MTSKRHWSDPADDAASSVKNDRRAGKGEASKQSLSSRIRVLAGAIEEGDDAKIEEAVLRLSGSPGAASPRVDPDLGRCRRPAARAVDDRGDASGSALVPALAGSRGRRDDGLLRGRPVAPDRSQVVAVKTRLGILMLGSKILLIPGIVLIAIGVPADRTRRARLHPDA